MSGGFVIFTDLDATLLDHRTYSCRAALPVLKKVEKKGIPVVLCTSKTRAETEVLSGKLGLKHPFIVENGGAIFIPDGYFPDSYYKLLGLKALKKDNYRVIQLGTSYRHLRSALKMMEKTLARKLIGFGDLSRREIAEITGLSQKEAELARRREYDEPFFLEYSPEFALIKRTGQPGKRKVQGKAGIDELNKRKVISGPSLGPKAAREREKLFRKMKTVARSRGLRITAGGRFFHLTGHNDKGRAVRILKKLYRLGPGMMITIGLGDSENDWPMLRVVDLPVLVARPDGRHLEIPEKGTQLLRTSRPGPEGWAEAINFLLGLQKHASSKTGSAAKRIKRR
ncbi:MAG: HAD-IIB family hydrolase [Candidatus Saccharicenans sp.]|jgi:mannosyl-3-phosphoglycerate phosphatase|nr:HAD-IIB family hydrolase [Candidatus Saccharicenans sp.]MDH7494186.1 HAD-IIB family hydrolase [Candidatus Saccharicenans sp.]